MEKQEKHITQTKQNLESLSALVLILNKESFLYYIGKKQPLIDLESMYLYKLSQLKTVGFLIIKNSEYFLIRKQNVKSAELH
jgi:hypothetical protein